MPDVIECPKCGKRYAWKAAMAGRNVKCKACEHAFTVPAATAPKQKVDNLLDDMFNEELTQDVASDFPTADAGSTTLAPTRPKSKTRKSQAGAGAGAFVGKHQLMVGLIVVTFLASAAMVVSGGLGSAAIVLLVGLAIAPTGLLPYPAPNESKSGNYFIVGSLVWWVGNISYSVYSGAVQVPSTANMPIFLGYIAGMLVGLACYGVIAFLISLIFRRFGFFRTAACGHLILAPVFTVVIVQMNQHHTSSNRPALAGANGEPTGGAMAGSAATGDGEVDLTAKEQAVADRFTALAQLSQSPVDEKRRAQVAREILPDVSHEDARIRKVAICALRIWHTEETIPAIIAALEDEEQGVRHVAFETLGYTKDVRAAEALVQNIDAKYYGGLAVKGLKRMGPLAEDAVLQLLDKDVIALSILRGILEEVGTQKTVTRLIDRFDTFSWGEAIGVRGTINAIVAAGRAEAPVFPETDSMTELEETLADASVEKASKGVPRELLTGPVDPQRREEVTRQMLELLATGDHFVRIDAAKALGRWHTEEAIPELIKLLTDDDTFVKNEAFAALGKTKDIRAIEAVAEIWATGHGSMAAEAALVSMGPVAEETVLKYLEVDQGRLFTRSLRVLEQIGTQKSVPGLAKLARSRNIHVSAPVQRTGRAIVAAGRTPEEPIGISANLPSVGALLESTQNPHNAVDQTRIDSKLAAQAITALKSDDPAHCYAAAEKLAQMLLVEEHCPPIAQALVGLLSHEQEMVRAAAMKALGTWHTPQSIPKMIEQLDDGSTEVYKAAMDALSKTKDVRAAAALADQLDGIDISSASRCLQAMGPVAEEAVLEYLDHANTTTLVMACKVLAEIGTQKSLPKLDSLADHTNISVGTAALKAAIAIRSSQ